ncbi:MAG TPA: hypothetical protein VG842_08835 [Sediminibacterium sp.]|nr:hypothetical protein [Sediminibacterium sp.]
MKKLFIAALFVVAASASAFAADGKSIILKAKYNFDSQFSGAENVQWNATENYIRAKFILADEPVEAFFGLNGDFIGASRKITLKSLPLSALQTLKKKYADYKVTDTIEFDRGDEKSYYVSIDNGKQKQILQVSVYGEVSRFK